MWEETDPVVAVLRVVIFVALVAILTVVALHGEAWSPHADGTVTGPAPAALWL